MCFLSVYLFCSRQALNACMLWGHFCQAVVIEARSNTVVGDTHETDMKWLDSIILAVFGIAVHTRTVVLPIIGIVTLTTNNVVLKVGLVLTGGRLNGVAQHEPAQV
ncbi:hypothetical protein N658DRAFT_489810 [Parathielavia hyrcaniae]|uniref:Uncharacterized protein n=1 Tax=Parathielavia hyrcaniae TaxID=113614 RepID=A0AAN6PV47_9PEZI|nr:hypothetical protein N658DRAFT_489810 [Parathielavia hyrcaniae]